jgi:hypothetical protein
MRSLDNNMRHPLSEAFHNVLKEMAEMHDRKQADYGRPADGQDEGDPFANIRTATSFGLKPWVGAAIRMNDKMGRIQAAARGQHLKNESVEDSFLDMAVYSIIALVLYREEQRSGQKQHGLRESMLKELEHFKAHNKFRSTEAPRWTQSTEN